MECDSVAYVEHAMRSGRLRVHDVKVAGGSMTKRTVY